MSRKANIHLLRDGWVPTQLIAKRLSKSPPTIHRMIKIGRLRGIREGGMHYVALDSLHEYYAESWPMRAAVDRIEKDLIAKGFSEMSQRHDPSILRSGYAPINLVAKCLGKTPLTVHRMIVDKRLKGQTVGHLCYVEIESLRQHYEAFVAFKFKLKELEDQVHHLADEISGGQK